MRINHLAGVLAIALVAVLAGASAQAQSRDAAIKGALKRIESGKVDELAKGRSDLTEVYRQEATAAGQSAAAADIAKVCVPALERLEGPRAVQLAMALSNVHDAAAVPALEAMVKHKEPAVRLLGWKAYLWTDSTDPNRTGVREQVLIKGGPAAAAMWKTLATRFEQESHSAVYGAMFEMMRLPTSLRRSTGPAVDAANIKVLESAWKGICQRIVDGDEEMTRSARSLVMTMEYFHRTNPAEQNKIAARLVEMMYYAAKSFDLENAKGDLADAAKQLLLDCDAMLRTVTRPEQQPKAVRYTNTDEDGPIAVLLAYAWGKTLKVDMDKVSADIKPKSRTKVTTRPATQPASAPASK